MILLDSALRQYHSAQDGPEGGRRRTEEQEEEELPFTERRRRLVSGTGFKGKRERFHKAIGGGVLLGVAWGGSS